MCQFIIIFPKSPLFNLLSHRFLINHLICFENILVLLRYSFICFHNLLTFYTIGRSKIQLLKLKFHNQEAKVYTYKNTGLQSYSKKNLLKTSRILGQETK